MSSLKNMELSLAASKKEMACERLKEWLQNDSVKAGGMLPAERVLSEKLGISRVTVRLALGDLEREGWIVRGANRRLLIADRASSAARATKPAGQGLIGLFSQIPFTKVVELRSSDMHNIVSSTVSEIESSGFGLAFIYTFKQDMGDPETWRNLAPSNLSGIIYHPAHGKLPHGLVKILNMQRAPVVVIEGYMDGTSGSVNTVDLDNAAGVKAAIKHMVRCGHRKIAHLTLGVELPWIAERIKGFEEGMRENGLEPEGRVWRLEGSDDEHLTGSCDSNNAFAAKAKTERVTAVIAASDAIALDFKDAAGKLGMKTPRDISLCGFDDSKEAFDARLSSISHMSGELGIRASQIILSALNSGNHGIVYRDRITPTLILRDSIAKHN